MAESSSLGFQVIPTTNMSSATEDRSTILASGSSEGFRSAYEASPIANRRDDPEDMRPASVPSVDSASFHTPEPYEATSQDEEVDLSIEIPDIEAPATANGGFVPDQPKLLLAEESVRGRDEKPPLPEDHTPHSNSRSQGRPRGQPNERTSLIHTEKDDTKCCVLF